MKQQFLEDKLLYLAQTDTMTGISNRRSGEKMIERVLNNKVSGMMCLVDCDKFKSINDTYGHMAGDEVIVAIAHTLQKSCRDKDVVMRLGGDEFALFIPGVTDRKCANAFFKRLFENLKQIQIESIKDHPIIMSLGACIYDGKEENLDFGYSTIGYNFEVMHFNQLLRENKTESPVMTFEFSRNLMLILDDVRHLIGLNYATDKRELLILN